MHTVEQYSLSCGLKIGTPYIFEKYYPIPKTKYILIYTDNSPSLNYIYWQEVFDLISPILKKSNINIVTLGVNTYNNCINLQKTPNYNQIAFIIKNSLLYCGVNSIALDIASYYQKKIVGIYSNIYSYQDKPYWSKEEDMILIDSKKDNLKPSYNQIENPIRINNIKPEIIANSILKSLNLELVTQHTIFTGIEYGPKYFEILPSSTIKNINSDIQGPLIIRFDYINEISETDYKIIIENLNYKEAIFIINKPIDIIKLSILKNKIMHIYYDVSKHPIDTNFLKTTKNLNIQISLFFNHDGTEEADINLNKRKLDIIDEYDSIQVRNDLSNFEEISEAKFYKSHKILYANDNFYLSKTAFLENKPTTISNNMVSHIQELSEIKDIKSLVKDNGHNCLFFK